MESRLTQLQWDVLHNPWRLSLDRFKCALDRSTELEKLIEQHTTNVSSLMVSTLFIKGQVQHAAKMVQQSSATHWWDIFSGLSVTARKTLMPPLLLLITAIMCLTLCNVLTCVYVRRVRYKIERILFHRLT